MKSIVQSSAMGVNFRRRYNVTGTMAKKTDKELIKGLKSRLKKVNKEVDALKDENESLWFLLDELKQSRIENFTDEIMELLEDTHEKMVKMRKSMVSKASEA